MAVLGWRLPAPRLAAIRLKAAWHEENVHDGRRGALNGGYRCATPGAGCGRAAAGAAELPRGDRARAAPAESVGRAITRRRLLPDGDPARAGRLRGRPADLPAGRGAAGRGRRLGRL